MAQLWERGSGELDPLMPLIGAWKAVVDGPMGSLTCERRFSLILAGTFVQLDAHWTFASRAGEDYQERAIFGMAKDGALSCWSFTSDGKRSEGKLASGRDVHPQAICFEAQMDAGLARQLYWPEGTSGMLWAAEAKGSQGWNRFASHHYQTI